ncbi:MAG: hypothetical protein O3B41_00700 [Bacteroidetes bacterium]|nr:hypothetical protein [Bacteroidota bacterium]
MKHISYIGIDGGGSKWEALGKLGDSQESLVIPGVNVRHESLELASKRLAELVQQVLYLLGSAEEVRICAGLAGAASPDIQKGLQASLAEMLSVPVAHISVVSDARVAFQAAFPSVDAEQEKASILVIAGTGSGCYSFGAKEEFFRSGGWGSTLGDPGSGTALGVAAVRHLLASVERRHFTPLDLAVWSALSGKPGSPANRHDLSTIVAILDSVYGSKFTLSNLAPIVLEHVSSDPDSLELVRTECRALATQAARLANRLQSTAPVVKLAGGLAENMGYFGAFQNAIRELIPNAIVSRVTQKPVVGALDLAHKMP